MSPAKSATGFLLPLVAIASLACAPEPPLLEATHPLVPRFPQARLSAEVVEMEVGSPAAGPHLEAGWSYRERDRSRQRAFRWGVGSHSEVRFFVVEPRDLTLALEGRPFDGSGAAGPQTVTVAINATEIAALELATDLAEYRLEVPATALRPGENRLTLAYRFNREPPATGDQRGLAAAWYRIAFEGLHAAASPPVAEPEGELLFIPYGTQVDWFLKLPPGGVLRADRWGFRGEAGGRLEVHIASDEGARRRLASLERAAELEVPLELAPHEPVRLSLRAIATDPSRVAGGALLARPTIWSLPPARPAVAPDLTAPPPRPNIVMYLVDTLRSDRLGCYGYDVSVSPRLDRFAREATLFESARAQSSWTLASVASIFTGVWPPSHGVTRNKHRLAPDALTLAEILGATGYQTSAVVTNGYVTGAFGLEQGFDHLELIHAAPSLEVHQRMVEWLQGRDRSRPFFLYLHTLDPHQPYLPPEEYRRRFAPDTDEVYRIIEGNRRKSHWDPTESNLRQLQALYDAEIAANDAAFGETLDYLEASGLLDEALVIFLSDHGEAFHEHYTWNHGSNLFAEVLNVPLVVKMPGQRDGRRVPETVQHVDLLPTLLDYLGLEIPRVEGRSLLGLLAGGSLPAAERLRPLFSQTSRFTPDTYGVIDGDWKYMERRDPRKGLKRYLYNWREDPGELRALTARRPILAAALRAAIDEKLAAEQVYRSEDSVIDETLRDQLRALGYLN